VSPGPPGPDPQAGARVTPIGARRTDVEDLQREVERLTAALHLAEQRRRTAEHTLAGVARTAAADMAELRTRLEGLEAEREATAPAVAAPPPVAPGGLRRRLWRGLLACGLVAGLGLAADGVATIVWQEPVTAVLQARSQASLRDDLGDLQATFAAAPTVQREQDTARMRRQARRLLDARPAGAALGRLEIPRIGLKQVFVESTEHDALTKGPGHYRGTVLPGLLGTVGLAGHRTTYGAPFRHLDELRVGSRIVLRMPYGRFAYRVTRTAITTPDDASSLRRQRAVHQLVLTACHPLYSAAQRIVVTARQTSATPIAT
jgi:sortase A